MNEQAPLPSPPSLITIVESASAPARLAAATAFVEQHPAGTEILVVGATRDAADDFVREVAAREPASFGLHRFSLLQLAAHVAAPALAAGGVSPASPLGVEALATRAAFDARREDALAYLTPIADRPGFPAALAATILDLRGAGLGPDRLPRQDACLADLRELLARFEASLGTFGVADVAALCRVAARLVREDRAPLVRQSALVLLDVPVETAACAEFVDALATRARRTLATVPAGDDRTLGVLARAGRAEILRLPPPETLPVGRLQSRLFLLDPPGGCREPDEARSDIEVFSAPGEGREAIEIARRAILEAERGTPFDRMAVLLRAPQLYGALVETAFRRAGIPAWSARGTSRPDPAGRAFLAVLACALERLSARRFAEYLSLGEVPDLPEARGAGAAREAPWVPARDELLREPAALPGTDPAALEPASDPAGPVSSGETTTEDADSDGKAVVAGTLRAPWNWERLLVDAAVIGSRERWQRRLEGLREELLVKLEAAEADEPGSPRAAAIGRDLRQLDHLRQFALPVIDRLSALPHLAPWREWIAALEKLAPAVLRRPERVLAVLADLRPLSEVGPVSLEEVHRVLAIHLAQLTRDPPRHRYGAVFVGTPEQARGRSFDVVFVPGLAERVFPQRAREDPLLLDGRRQALGAGLPLRDDTAQKERLLLRLAAGAAARRLYVSYPRMELAEARARVPSFYALDVDRAATGRMPDFEALARQAEQAGQARLAWPAPPDARLAIDDSERDLAVLGGLLRQDRARSKGRARFLLALNPHLARALRARWARAGRRWSAADGLYAAGEPAREVLAAHRLGARPYSVSALQRFATCPYQFLLATIHRLAPREEADWLEELDPLTRGRLFHEVQARATRQLMAPGALRRAMAHRDRAMASLDHTLDSVASEYAERLAPAIDRVWESEIEALRTDLHGWLDRLLDGGASWEPIHAELGIGFPPGEGRDPASLAAPVTLAGGWRLHGIIDLVEQRAGAGTLRVTDHKTGRVRTEEGVVVGGGEALQPALYALALGTALGRTVEAGRLFYCTLAGAYTERVVPVDAQTRRIAEEVLQIVDRAVDLASLPPAPREGACRYCDFRLVCGPDEERRTARKDPQPLADVRYLRGLP